MTPTAFPAFFHERSTRGFRRRFGRALEDSDALAVALTRLRLSTIDLSRDELANVQSIRLVLAELRSVELDAEAHALMARRGPRARMARLQSLLDRDVVRIRVAPLAGWSPDFSVFSRGGEPSEILLGFHAFEQPHPYAGPALGAHFGPGPAAQAAERFEEIWSRGHDVGPAIHTIFRRARRWFAASERPRPGRKSVDSPAMLG